MTTDSPQTPSGGPRRSPASGTFRRASRTLASVSRWLHIYLSMFAFATMLLFSITGLTLNHPDWFGAGEATTVDQTSEVPLTLLGSPTEDPDGTSIAVDQLAALVRGSHGLRGQLDRGDIRIDDLECSLSWKAPGYAADAVIDRETGRCLVSITSHGFVEVINDLHKGRDTGAVWSLVIDATAVLLTLVALTGFVLIFFIRRRRVPGLVASLIGTLVIAAAAIWLLQ